MWPRPVCIEYGQHDDSTPPEWHQRAWGKVSQFASAWNMTDNVVRDHFYGEHEIHAIGTIDFLNHWLRPDLPAGRDYADRVEHNPPDAKEAATDSAESLPYVTNALDSGKLNLVQGTFYVSRVNPVLSGIAVKASRVENPGDLLMVFGSHSGAADLGRVRITAQSIARLEAHWVEVKVPVERLDPEKLYYLEARAESGELPDDYYILYGPRPLGGKCYPPEFPWAFHVLSAARPIPSGNSRQGATPSIP